MPSEVFESLVYDKTCLWVIVIFIVFLLVARGVKNFLDPKL